MGLDKLVEDETKDSGIAEEPDNPKITDVTLSLTAWRFILSQTKCHIPINDDEMEAWEVERIVQLINHELSKKRPFGKDPSELPLKHMNRYRDRLEEKLSEMT